MPSATVSRDRYSRPSDTQATADAIPILVDDEYHVFHLSTPSNTVRHPPRLRSTWSRLRSRDLVNWKRDEVEALYPGKDKQSPDADGAWTGCALIGPDGNMHLFYTGYNLSHGGKQVILHARSTDVQGTAFVKSACAIGIRGDMSRFEDIDFRDAHVSWNEPEQCYWMLVATRLRTGPYWTRGCLALLTSSDLEEWEIEPEPFYAPNDMFCPECPELFSLPNGKWYLVYSRFHAPDAGTVYRMADSPRGPFRTPRGTSGGRFDGRRWYAAKSCQKAGDPNTRVYFGWVADKLEGQWSWGGDMGIPREVFADESGRLHVRPSRKFLDAAFRSTEQAVELPPTLQLDEVGKTTTRFFPVGQSDYRLEFSITSQDAASFGLMFRTYADMSGHRLRFTSLTPDLMDMSLLTCPPPLDDFWADQYDLHLPRDVDGPEITRHPVIDAHGKITVVTRHDVLEIFAGGKSISYRLPREEKSTRDEQRLVMNGPVDENTNVLQANASATSCLQELGIFVEDGIIALSDIVLQNGVALV
ncbi:glycoside hydrolase family 32 protein [Lophiostoma macrostomum CBS 122681]|uniref:beta-fructofuranosidase n=1 Tax=Lophiostoma macrostomum CBS 122681 TaxID=1314788 RepID=A0A6A6T0S5_9PLEO|nr:glycoside hydrolase family 32 protein [Lophiostoma macrostomum CBS 122681]